MRGLAFLLARKHHGAEAWPLPPQVTAVSTDPHGHRPRAAVAEAALLTTEHLGGKHGSLRFGRGCREQAWAGPEDSQAWVGPEDERRRGPTCDGCRPFTSAEVQR